MFIEVFQTPFFIIIGCLLGSTTYQISFLGEDTEVVVAVEEVLEGVEADMVTDALIPDLVLGQDRLIVSFKYFIQNVTQCLQLNK